MNTLYFFMNYENQNGLHAVWLYSSGGDSVVDKHVAPKVPSLNIFKRNNSGRVSKKLSHEHLYHSKRVAKHLKQSINAMKNTITRIQKKYLNKLYL